MSSENLEGLEPFRRVQRLAYDAVTEVARGLEAGVTEREAAARVGRLLRERGVRHFFHQPFAWFGDRARFANFRTPLQFFPTRRKLEPGMCAILDVAPMVDGYAADVGYAFALGESAEVTQALGHLEAFRKSILASVLAEKPLRAIYSEVDGMIRDLGYENCHKRYPFGVLAHRVDRARVPLLSRGTLLGFGPGSAAELLGQVASSLAFKASAKWPFWNHTVPEEARAQPGLWAVEPHMGRGDVGVKWEELMVVTESSAHWLDEDVPHVHAWRQSAGEKERALA